MKCYKHDPELFENAKSIIKSNLTYNLFFDGASDPNPGPSGAGYIIYDKRPKRIF